MFAPVCETGEERELGRAIDTELVNDNLLQNGSFLMPSVDQTSPFGSADDLDKWYEAGFQFCLAKKHNIAQEYQQTLARIFGLLRAGDAPSVPPYWITEDYIATLYLPNACDLRPIKTSEPAEDAKAVHDLCVGSLSEFLALQETLLDAMKGTDPPCFPVRDRYLASLEIIEAHLRARTCSGLCEMIEDKSSQARTSVFFGPKPANMIVRTQDRTDLRRNAKAPVYRIDLDMLYWQSPLALQLVLIYFAFPVALEIKGTPQEQFESQLLCLANTCGELNARSADFAIGDKLVGGCVYLPASSDRYVALRGKKGIYKNGRAIQPAQPAHSRRTANREPDFPELVEVQSNLENAHFTVDRLGFTARRLCELTMGRLAGFSKIVGITNDTPRL